VNSELLAGSVARIGIVIYWHGKEESGSGAPKIMERYMLDVSSFPVVEKGDRNMEIEWEKEPGFASENEEEAGPARPKDKGKMKEKRLDEGVDVDLSEQFRAALIMLNTRCSSLAPLPKNCSYNICMELKDEADVDPPLGHPQPWIPVQPSLQMTGRKGAVLEQEGEKRKEGEDLGGVQTTPIRTVEAGVFRFETWIEEGKAKFEVGDAAKSSFGSSVG
jgi:mitotic spindle assembly checkpoint protein MAD2B